MSAIILDGKRLAEQIQSELASQVETFRRDHGLSPCLAAVLVGDDPASEVYVRTKQRACERSGMASQLFKLPSTTSEAELQALVHQLNTTADVHGILLQLPLPKQLSAARLLEAVSPLKDVDAFHPENVGRLVQGQPRFRPCTPHGIQQLLLRHGVQTRGQHVVIVGRSEIVGKPLANMLVQRGAGGDATVTVCHSQTRDLASLTRLADILVVAIGQPRFVTADMVRPGAIVIDVGTNRTPDGLVGDVDFPAVREIAGMITPVPGGVGPLTVTMLLNNTLEAARLQLGAIVQR